MSNLDLQSGHVHARLANGVLCVTLDRVKKRNALTAAMYADLKQSVEHAQANDDVRAVLFDAEGDMFCAGNDIADFAETGPTDHASVNASPAMMLVRALAALDKPSVVAVQGQATGIGTTWLLHVDLVVAADDARFYTAFIDIGIVPEAGSSMLLPALIGRPNAARLLLAGDTLSAEEALRMGLIAYLVAPAQLADRARELAERLAAKPPVAMRHAKQLLRAGLTCHDLETQIDREAERLAERLSSDDVRARFDAFLGR